MDAVRFPKKTRTGTKSTGIDPFNVTWVPPASGPKPGITDVKIG